MDEVLGTSARDPELGLGCPSGGPSLPRPPVEERLTTGWRSTSSPPSGCCRDTGCGPLAEVSGSEVHLADDME